MAEGQYKRALSAITSATVNTPPRGQGRKKKARIVDYEAVERDFFERFVRPQRRADNLGSRYGDNGTVTTGSASRMSIGSSDDDPNGSPYASPPGGGQAPQGSHPLVLGQLGHFEFPPLPADAGDFIRPEPLLFGDALPAAQGKYATPPPIRQGQGMTLKQLEAGFDAALQGMLLASNQTQSE